MAGNAPAGGGGGSANPFMGGSKLAFGLTLNPKKAKKKETKAPLKPALDLFAGAEDEAEAEGTDFRGAAQLAREQAKYSMANARVCAVTLALTSCFPTKTLLWGATNTNPRGACSPAQPGCACW